jgi:hypothetical protein
VAPFTHPIGQPNERRIYVREAIKREMSGVVYDRAQKEEERLSKLNDARRRSMFFEERSDKEK